MYELFDMQPENYRNDIVEQNSLVVTLEADIILAKIRKGKGLNLGRINLEKVHLIRKYIIILIYQKKITNFIQKLRE